MYKKLDPLRATRVARSLIALTVAGAVAACGGVVPKAGPNERQLLDSSVQQAGNAFVVPVDDEVARETAVFNRLGFSSNFINADELSPDTIRPGDVLGLTIWENVVEGLLARGGGAAVIEQVQVDSAGFIFIPYAGRIRAAGNTPEALRGIITRALETQTPDPQVTVRRIAGNGATVTVVGGVGSQGVFPIDRPTRKLSSVLAQAGGVVVEADVAQISVLRGNEIGRIWLTDLLEDPSVDIAVRGGDRVIVEEDRRTFISLGATGTQTRVPFVSQDLSAIEAIASVGGLNSNLADATGIFVLREEDQATARKVLNRNDIQGEQRIIYAIDLTQPNGMFTAGDFIIQDGDTMFVTEAALARWSKVISLTFGSIVQPAANLNTLAN
ncbi:polysaccharide biosynthesis/export family protein [Tropicimonas sp. S265A]|uniref:polysaccharide biosynthesis/export family protein n=1 Tax=Tropicimonas sp. S265A TaxID=3415134 RepID=UPI003C7D5E22